jgi:hypothetical protein
MAIAGGLGALTGGIFQGVFHFQGVTWVLAVVVLTLLFVGIMSQVMLLRPLEK